MLTSLNLQLGELTAFDFSADSPQLVPPTATKPSARFGEILKLRNDALREQEPALGEHLPQRGNALPPADTVETADPESIVASMSRELATILQPVALPAAEPAASPLPAAPQASAEGAPATPAPVLPATDELVARSDTRPGVQAEGVAHAASLVASSQHATAQAAAATPIAPVTDAAAGKPVSSSMPPPMPPPALPPELREAIAVRLPDRGELTDQASPGARAAVSVATVAADRSGVPEQARAADRSGMPAKPGNPVAVVPARNDGPRIVEAEPVPPSSTAQSPQRDLQATETAVRFNAASTPAMHAADASLPPPRPGTDIAAPPPTSLRPIDVPVQQPGWGDALSERVVMMAANKQQQAEIRLTPAELGPLRVQVNIEDGTTTVSFQAASPVTREVIEQALPRLRDMLAEHGLTLADAEVGDDGALAGRHDDGPEAGGAQARPEMVADEPVTADGVAPRQAAKGLVDTFA